MRTMRTIGVLMACGLLTTPVTTRATGQDRSPIRLASIRASQTTEGIEVVLQAPVPLTPLGIDETAGGAPRIFIDLPGVTPGERSYLSDGLGVLRRIRVALHLDQPVITRVVLDLRERVAFTHRTDPATGWFIVLLKSPATAPPPPPPPPETRPQPSPAKRPQLPPANRPQAPTATTPESPARAEAARASASVPVASAISPATPPAPSGDAKTPAETSTGASAAAPSSSSPPPVASSQTATPIGMGRSAQGPRPWGRASFFLNSANMHAIEPGGTGYGYAEYVSTITYQMPAEVDGNGLEYGLDFRHSGYTLEGRTPRVSLYDGFVGARVAGGRLRVRGGHMWMNDLGSLGSVAGGVVEVRQPGNVGSTAGRYRFGVFGGLEPSYFETGYADNIRKFGGYFALEGARNRRHVVGYVNVRNASLTERSVVTFSNYLPIGPKVFVYQAGEYDLAKPAGEADAGLAYLVVNGRYSATSRVELQANYNRGRSIDARGIGDDILAGRPISPRAVEGFLYQTIGGRVTVEVVPRVRLYAGYSRDRNNRDDEASGRLLVGGFASDVAKTGMDLSFSVTRNEQPTGSYHSTYFSAGRQLGRRIYVSGDYTTSLSLVRFSQSDGIVVTMEPHTSRLSGTGVVTIGRPISLLITVERTADAQVTEFRTLSGIAYRFDD